MPNIKSITKEIANIRESLIDFIKGLPEANTGIKFIAPNCGIVSFSTIQKNDGILNPAYYLNSTVKDELIKIIQTTKIEALENKIDNIILSEKIGIFQLNPEFIEQLKQIWNE